ncbi:SIR2 family protein [Geomesophilobacter sediminis]|uniref:SIR2 family protein n=1 Tax=Geomesophilobacter sediminis TaxID=2798584 RepID=A0A8J7JKT0_9BACT|nr:SIR2 family protein [Geomesophilobacter sediminis]MBJ6724160.1 SIR2 family protein [Geomesophilobacter sediminis]
METTYLLGAGASIEAGIPATLQMAKLIHESARNDKRICTAIETAVGGLHFHRSVAGKPFGGVDVESLYAILKILGERHNNILGPFVGSWSHTVTAADRPKLGDASDSICRALEDAISHAGDRSEVFHDIRKVREGLEEALVAASGASGSVFMEAAAFVLRQVLQLTQVKEDDQVSYLLPFILQAQRKPLWIASLNYDDVIETAAKRVGIPVDRGLNKDSPTVSFSQHSRICLAKLHGSRDWKLSPDGVIPNSIISWNEEPCMIFGLGNKLTVKGPYLDLLFAFRSRLEKTDELQVCGYSFRDEHVNHIILNWLIYDRRRRLVVADPGLDARRVQEELFINKKSYYIQYHDKMPRNEQIAVCQLKASQWVADQLSRCKKEEGAALNIHGIE